MKSKIIYIICASALLSSCHIYKVYKRPEVNTAGIYRNPVSDTDTIEADTTNMGNLPWKEVFRDPYLQALIEQGLASNVDMQTAILRVEEAKVMLTSAKLSYLPSINFAPQGTISTLEHSRNAKAYSVPLAASWEIDLFGKMLNAKRGAKATLLQSDAYRQAVRSQLIAGIANTYYTLLMLDKQVQISEKTAVIWKDNVRAMEAMKEAGMTNEAAVAQSKANSHQIEATLADLRRQVRETENALSVILAQAPQRIERGILENQQLPDNLEAGVPLQLLANRPDVKAAEMTLAAAYYSTNQARAAFYPSLTIGGTAGWTNGSGMSVANPGKLLLQALGSLTQPIFNRGKLVANLKVSKAEEKIAQLNYQQAILNAGQEVSNALFLYETAGKKLDEHRIQVETLSRAVQYTQDLFHSGSASYLEILTAQSSLLSAQLNEVSDTFQRMQAVINLYEAVGGGRE